METPTISLFKAAQTLHCTYRRLDIYQKRGWLQTIAYHRGSRTCQGLSTAEFQRLKTVLIPDDQHQTLQNFADQEHLALKTVKDVVRQLKISTDMTTLHPNHHPHTQFYRKTDLKKVTAFIAERNQHVQYLDLYEMESNTNRAFQRQTDYTVFTLGRFLNPEHPANNRMIIQWIQYHRIPYSIDLKHKLYFTPEQAQQIKARYQNRSADHTIPTKQIAEMLDTTPAAINKFGKKHQIIGEKVLGYLAVFYNPAQVEQFKTAWRTARHNRRPKNLKYKKHPKEESHAKNQTH